MLLVEFSIDCLYQSINLIGQFAGVFDSFGNDIEKFLHPRLQTVGGPCATHILTGLRHQVVQLGKA